jgi:hypothetical protein
VLVLLVLALVLVLATVLDESFGFSCASGRVPMAAGFMLGYNCPAKKPGGGGGAGGRAKNPPGATMPPAATGNGYMGCCGCGRESMTQ